jgi:outer membrane lipoprotein SlyB
MQLRSGVMTIRPRLVSAILLAATLCSCATTTTTSTTWTASAGPPRFGYVESVQEIVQRVEGNPAGGALAGALIGGFLFGRGPGRLIGAAGGAALGAAASQGYSERRTYQVLVHFDDGTYGMFVFGSYAPFRPGEAVVLTPQGLTRR